MPANLENSAVATGLEKVSFHSNAKEGSNYHTIALISHASKVMLKILQARLQQYVNWELPDVQAGLRKDRGARDQIANSAGSKRKQGDSRKTSASLTMLKPLTVWITTNCGKFLNRWEYQTTLPVSWETCMWVKKQHLELNIEHWTGSKFREEYKALYCHAAYLTYMQSTSYERPGWMNHKLESKIARQISITSYRQVIPP